MVQTLLLKEQQFKKKTAEDIGDLIGNKINHKITSESKTKSKRKEEEQIIDKKLAYQQNKVSKEQMT